jgi:putative sterol carrier protein
VTTTPTDIFGEIDAALKADPDRVAGLTATYQFDLSGDDGGQFFITMRDGTGEAGEGAAEEPNITISMTASDFVDVRSGRLDPTMAFMGGRLKIKGDMGLAMKLQSVLRQ